MATCKCGADTQQQHFENVDNGYVDHVYSGFYWSVPE